MRGSYEYIGADGLTYVVDWYADETGYHPSAPHLPQPVEIPFPEQAEAVAAQIRCVRVRLPGTRSYVLRDGMVLRCYK